jgi:kumamolisin
MIHMRKTRLTAGILLGAGALIAPFAVASGASAASGTSPNAPTQVPSGISAAQLPGTTVLGNTPKNQKVIVSFILKMNNMSSLEASVEHGIPSAAYLSVAQFASRYGQSASNISALTSYLAGFNISTSVYADDLDVVATGKAGDFDKALTITEENVSVPAEAGNALYGGGRQGTYFTNTQEPLLPFHLASFVTAILGLSNYGPYVSETVKPAAETKPQAGSNATCIAEFGLSNGCHLPQDFAQMYNLNPLYARANGTGQTIGIVTLAAVDSGPATFWSTVSHTNRTGQLIVDNVDGGPGAPSAASGTVETDLDIEQSGALAPGANIIDYQAPNTDYGFIDAFFTAASQNIASGVSASWGESETVIDAAIRSGEEAAGYIEAFDESYLEMAAQGQSAFTSSADEGAYTASGDLGTTNLSADQPADSPFITAAGATSLPGSTDLAGPDGTAVATNNATRIWGWDYLWAGIASTSGESLTEAAETDVVGSGGGFSVDEPEPSYQRGVSGTNVYHGVEYLTPTDFVEVAPGLTEPIAWNFNPTPSVSFGGGSGRAIPDVSTDGDPQTGYLVYSPSIGGLSEFGGTSFVDPQLNGSTSVIDSYVGHRVGFWNPVMYGAVANGVNNIFTNINTAGTSNDNIFYTGNPGDEYNEGIGLGQPNLFNLTKIFSEILPF